MRLISSIAEMNLDGGIPCLDFVNTGLDRDKGDVVERLYTYIDLLTLTQRLKLLPTKTVRSLALLAKNASANAEKHLSDALHSRELMMQVFGHLADHSANKIKLDTINNFNVQIAHAVSLQKFVLSKGMLNLSMPVNESDLCLPLSLLWLSAFELLTQKNQAHIKRCARCQWLFVDETKSHRRKWCNMLDCGSKEKSKRYYQRKTHAKASS